MQHWTSDPRTIVQPKLTDIGGFSKDKPQTVFEVFLETVNKYGSNEALHFKENNATQFSSWTWMEYQKKCFDFAKSLIHLKFQELGSTNIIGFNSKEWFVSHFGTIAAGGIAAGIYPSNLPDACHYISSHSKAEVIVVEDNKQLIKYLDLCDKLPDLKAIVVYNEAPSHEMIQHVKVYHWDAFMELGKNVPDWKVSERVNAQVPGQCAALIYTSGTTGPPKAVMLSHDNITWTTKTLAERFPQVGRLGNGARSVTFLPLSHIAAQILDMYIPALAWGSQIYFAQPDALKGSLVTTLKEVRPQFFFGVPRVYEKIHEKLLAVGSTLKGPKKTISKWAKAQALKKNEKLQYDRIKNNRRRKRGSNKVLSATDAMDSSTEKSNAEAWVINNRDRLAHGTWKYRLARKAILSKAHRAIGLDQCLVAGVAAAPISVNTLRYFASLDIPIYECFGQSECTGPHTVSTCNAWKIGACGRPLPGTQTKIDQNTGELCYRGRHIFMGYMHNPEKTAEAIDDDGWLHSGDVARLDKDEDPLVHGPSGFLTITGRIKELIITAGGENIPPVPIEVEFKKAIPALANCMVIGDKQKYLVIFFCLKVTVEVDGTPKSELLEDCCEISRSIGSSATTVQEARNCPEWKRYLESGMKTANSKATSRAQIVQKYAILPSDFSEKGGELTPTLKLKRSVVLKKYSEYVEQLYS
mmetsp:Transcript_27808/g.36458  ORF Transcript_27808/g.36458 Transcript_27808/m.36458 type:complete len:696 (+) Transcript_27808:334-2421(+)